MTWRWTHSSWHFYAPTVIVLLAWRCCQRSLPDNTECGLIVLAVVEKHVLVNSVPVNKIVSDWNLEVCWSSSQPKKEANVLSHSWCDIDDEKTLASFEMNHLIQVSSLCCAQSVFMQLVLLNLWWSHDVKDGWFVTVRAMTFLRDVVRFSLVGGGHYFGQTKKDFLEELGRLKGGEGILTITHAVTGTMCKLHTERTGSQEWTRAFWCCEVQQHQLCHHCFFLKKYCLVLIFVLIQIFGIHSILFLYLFHIIGVEALAADKFSR